MAIDLLRIIFRGSRSVWGRRSGANLRQLRDAGVYGDTTHLDIGLQEVLTPHIFCFWGKPGCALYGKVCGHDKLRSNLEGLMGRHWVILHTQYSESLHSVWKLFSQVELVFQQHFPTMWHQQKKNPV